MKRILILVVPALVLVLSACGNSATNKAASGNTTTTAAGAGASSFADYQACMKQNGVTLPDRTPGQNGRPGRQGTQGDPPAGATPPGDEAPSATQDPANGGRTFNTTAPAGVDQATYNKALDACKDKRPTGNNRNGVNGANFTAYLSCLKDHGVNVDATAGGRALQGLDRTTDAFKAANATCQALIPTTTTTTVAA